MQVTRRGFLHGSALATTVAATGTFTLGAHPQTDESGSERGSRVPEETALEALLARMTLDEKLGQLTQSRGRVSETDSSLPEGAEEAIRNGQLGSFLGLYGAQETRRLQQIAVEESRLGIPLLFADDVIHGFRTIFPVPLAEAASFDADEVENAARVAATEAAAHGLHWTFAPMVDIARDPRWGRIVEGSGEDPYLGSILAAARVRGFQGHDLAADDTLLATVKHFVAYGAVEGGRDYNTVDISRRTLYEIYLPPFRAAVEAGAQAVMVAFNELAGIPMHANKELIRGVLRGEWGFDGLVISDYTGVRELITHGVAATPEAAAMLAIRAGIDIDMVSGVYRHDLREAVRAKRLTESFINEATRHVLRAKYRLGLFERPYHYSDAGRQRARTLTRKHRNAARQMARKSLVLLKNEGRLLPLPLQGHTIAVIGPLADDPRAMLGSWSAAGLPEDVVTPLEGIRAAVAPGTRILHARGVPLEGTDLRGISEAEGTAREADIVLLFVGERHDMTGEARSRSSLDLPGSQEALARALKATGKPLAVVLLTGRPLSIDWLAQNVPSILLAWFPGVEAGHAIADVLFGAYNPAGRVPLTFPRTVGQIPIYYAHKNTGRPDLRDSTDDTPVDQNTSKYLDISSTPLYPFGYGLSYTTFAYEDLKLSAPRISATGRLNVRFAVINTGEMAGDEVVQLYLHDLVASVSRPVKQLRRFQRIHLAPHERRELTFELGPDDLSYYGPDLRPIVEPGTFTVSIGGSSSSLIEASFEVEAARNETPSVRARDSSL